MYKKAIGKFHSLFFTLNSCIIHNNKTSFRYLVEAKNVNKPSHADSTPLLMSLICNRHEFSFILLEHSADPNQYFEYYSGEPPISLLQDRVNSRDLAQAKLLIYYGGQFDNVTVTDKLLEQELAEASRIYKEHIAPYQNTKTPESYQALAKTWQRISDQEQDPELKVCYRKKAQTYIMKLDSTEFAFSEKLFHRHACKRI